MSGSGGLSAVCARLSRAAGGTGRCPCGAPGPGNLPCRVSRGVSRAEGTPLSVTERKRLSAQGECTELLGTAGRAALASGEWDVQVGIGASNPALKQFTVERAKQETGLIKPL